MNVFERSSVFAAEMMEVFDRTPTEKELIFQSKELCRVFIHSRIVREGLSWSKVEFDLLEPHGALADISAVLLKLGKKTRNDALNRCDAISVFVIQINQDSFITQLKI